MAAGFVLVGGRSTRMGLEKALLPFRGRPLAVWQAETLSAVCDRVSVVGKEPILDDPRFRFVRDLDASPAALLGIEAALASTGDEWNLVLAVDLPCVPPPFLEELLRVARASGCRALAPVSGGKVQALCSAWRRDALDAVRSRIRGGRLSVVGALEEAGALIVPEEETASFPGGSPASFLNVNTPEEHAALARVEAGFAA